MIVQPRKPALCQYCIGTLSFATRLVVRSRNDQAPAELLSESTSDCQFVERVSLVAGVPVARHRGCRCCCCWHGCWH